MNRIDLADPAYVQDQYRGSTNLDARIALHERFSTAKCDLHEWVFDHFDFPGDARILEIGCGTGKLWLLPENRSRIPATWHLTLSDLSLGMIDTACGNGVRADFLESDAQSIPFRDGYFDAVIANHMLYHVPDLSRALAELRRVLKSTGKFYAATNGKNHLRKLDELICDFLHTEPQEPFKGFSLENGAEKIGKHFSRVERFDFPAELVVTEIEPLVAYILSGFRGVQLMLKGRETELREFIAKRIECDGAIHITTAPGLFIATR